MAHNDYAVAIAGGGPVGLMLAGELKLAGVEPVIVERRSTQALAGSRAGGLHARTIECLDQRGIADRFLRAGQIAQTTGFAWNRLAIDDFPTRHNYGLALWQNHIERLLAEWVRELSVPHLYGTAVTGFSEDNAGVDVALSDGRTLRTHYLVGCDGAKSLVRKEAGIAFPGFDPTISHLIAEAEMADVPPWAWGIRHDALGFHGLSKIENANGVRILVTERELDHAGEPSLDDLARALTAVYGSDFGVRGPAWISRFTDMARQAQTYRKGRILLAGDAAHIHHSVGGQGLNTGVQDAVNLGWKLALAVKGVTPEGLLDSYHAERHPVAARVLQNTMAQIALLRRADDGLKALRANVSELLGMEEPRKRFAGMLSGLDIRYDLGEGHPLLGRRMPDFDLVTAKGTQRVYELLHRAEPLLLDFESLDFDIAPWADRVRLVRASYDGAWELPVAGIVPAPGAVLVRPDGHVAWVGDGKDAGLAEALTRWFQNPSALRT